MFIVKMEGFAGFVGLMFGLVVWSCCFIGHHNPGRMCR